MALEDRPADLPSASEVSTAPSRIGWSEAHSHRDRPRLRRDPLRVYATRAVIWDGLAVTIAGLTGFILRWAIPFNVELNDPTYISLVVIVVIAWLSVLVLRGAYDTRMLGVGSEEFKRVVSATATVFGAVAIVVFVLKLDLSRGFVVITFVVGLTLLLIVRWALRGWLRHERRYGHFLHRTIVVGAEPTKSEIVDMLDRDPVAGFTVVDVVDEPAADVEDAVVLAEKGLGLLAPRFVSALELRDEAGGGVGRHFRDGVAYLGEVRAEVAGNPHQRDAGLLPHERGAVAVEALRDAGGPLIVARCSGVEEVAATPALAGSSAVADLVGSFGHIRRGCCTPRRG